MRMLSSTGETEDRKRKTVNRGRLRERTEAAAAGGGGHTADQPPSQGHTQQEQRQNRTEDSWSKTQIQAGEN